MLIKIFCNAGMSTGLLVDKMNDYAKSQGYKDVNVKSYPTADFYDQSSSADAILLGPQVGYMKEKYYNALSVKNIPVEVIPMVDYGTMNGKAVLEFALNLKNEKNK